MKILTQENNKTLPQLQAENAALREQVEKLNAQIIWFKEQVKLIRHKQFGKQSEQTHTVLSLFDDNESDEVTETEEPISASKIRVTFFIGLIL